MNNDRIVKAMRDIAESWAVRYDAIRNDPHEAENARKCKEAYEKLMARAKFYEDNPV